MIVYISWFSVTIFVWVLRNYEKHDKNQFFRAFSGTQPNTRKYFPKHFLECNQTLENIFLSRKYFTLGKYFTFNQTQPNYVLELAWLRTSLRKIFFFFFFFGWKNVTQNLRQTIFFSTHLPNSVLRSVLYIYIYIYIYTHTHTHITKFLFIVSTP